MEIYNDTYKVYVHLNKFDGKCYIGVTKKNNPNGRWHNGNGYSYNEYFYRAIKKYGWENFEHIIFASNLTKDEASNMERLLIEKLQTENINYGYNLCSGGYDCQGMRGERNPMYGKKTTKAVEASIAARIGKHLFDEHKQKISAGNKGKQKSKEAIAKAVATKKATNSFNHKKGGESAVARQVLCIETGEKFKSLIEAATSIGVHSSAIIQAIKYNGRSKGFHWSYL